MYEFKITAEYQLTRIAENCRPFLDFTNMGGGVNVQYVQGTWGHFIIYVEFVDCRVNHQ
jgi:hypothetical protein